MDIFLQSCIMRVRPGTGGFPGWFARNKDKIKQGAVLVGIGVVGGVGGYVAATGAVAIPAVVPILQAAGNAIVKEGINAALRLKP